ncbi:MAG: hypothetical protein WB946_07565 [Halobacteriota archaeon]
MTYATDLHAQDKHSKLKAISCLPHYQLPREFRELTGTRAEIYQTSYDDGIAFLVKIVDRSQKKLSTGPIWKMSLHTAEVAGSNPAEPTSVCKLT